MGIAPGISGMPLMCGMSVLLAYFIVLASYHLVEVFEDTYPVQGENNCADNK